MSPVRIASIPARATALVGSRPPSGRMIPAITAASEESGPSTITREGPNTAYTSSGTMVAYSPVIGGSPAACAYPHPHRDQKRRQDQPGHQVVGEPSPRILPDHPNPRHPPTKARARRPGSHPPSAVGLCHTRPPASLSGEGTKPTG